MSSIQHEHDRRAMLSATGSAIVAVSTVGCVGGFADRDRSDESSGTGSLGSPTDRMTVSISSDPAPEFAPQIVHVDPGTTVEWLVETGRHDVTAYHEDTRSFMHQAPHRTPDGVGPWRSDVLDGPGANYERTFDVEGVYDYVDKQQVCVSHEVAGNVGRVVVGWPDPDDEPAMRPPPGELPKRVVRALKLFNEKTHPVLDSGPNETATAGGNETYRPDKHTTAETYP